MNNNKKKNIPEVVQEPAAVYKAGRAKNIDIPLDENGLPVGHSLKEFSELLLDKLSERYGTDIRKL
ncbi:MAG: hypothetical protein LBR26_13015 [Prevotella sp.]|nr:hypothetical protein [Prevotella sp.]